MSFAGDANTIVAAVDGSPSASGAVELAVAIASSCEAALVFVHVVRTLDFVSDDVEEDAYAVPHEPTESERAVLDAAVARARESGVDATTSLRFGSIAEEIAAYADVCNADLIVVGTRGRGRVASAIFGSVSLAVLHKSKRPVVIVRGTRSTRGIGRLSTEEPNGPEPSTPSRSN